MSGYFIKRLAKLVSVLLGAALFVFLIFNILTGAFMSGQYFTTPQAEAALAPPDLPPGLPATIELLLAAMLIATLAGIAVGVVSAAKQHSAFDYIGRAGTLLGMSMPVFWLGMLLALLFSTYLGWLPASGRIDTGLEPAGITGLFLVDSLLTGKWEAFASALRHLILPAVALASYPMAIIARVARRAMLDVFNQPYLRTARAKGLSERMVVYRHALRNAMIPVVAVTGRQAGSLLGGVILIETVFAWPGIGGLLVDSMLAADYPLAGGCVLFMLVLYSMVKLFMELLNVLLDPGTRYF